MGKTRDLFKKIRDTKGIFHVKMSTIKGRNNMGVREAEGIKQWLQEYIEELNEKDHNDSDNHCGVITDLEPDILNVKSSGPLESITINKASGGMEFQLSYFKS